MAWHFARHDGEIVCWARWGRWSVWVDTAMGRLEVNGAALTDLLTQREDPLLSVAGKPWEASFTGELEGEAAALFSRVAEALRKAGGGPLALLSHWAMLLGVGAVLVLAAPWPPWGGIMLLPSLLWLGVGARTRGLKGIAFSLITLALLQHPSTVEAPLAWGSLGLVVLTPMVGLGALGRTLAAMTALWIRQERVADEFALGRGLLILLGGLGWAALSLWRRRFRLGLSGAARWRAHLMADAFSKVDSSALWILDALQGAELPPLAARVRALPWVVDASLPVYEVVGAGRRWIFLPEAIWVHEGSGSERLFPLSQCHVAQGPCEWEAAPPGLGHPAWLVTMAPPQGVALTLLFGDCKSGQAFAERFSAWTLSAPLPREGVPSEAELLLGVSPGASFDEIKHAYLKAVKQWHPDRYPNASPKEREALEARMKALNEAYDALEASHAKRGG